MKKLLILLILLAVSPVYAKDRMPSIQKEVELLQEQIAILNDKDRILTALIEKNEICPSGWQKSRHWITTEMTDEEPRYYSPSGLLNVEICPDNGLLRVKP